MTSELLGSRLRAGHRQEALQVPAHPEPHAGLRDFRVELKPNRVPAAPRLDGKGLAGGQQFGSRRQGHCFGMPLVEMHRFRKDRWGAVGRDDPVPAHFAMAHWMHANLAADGAGEQLPTETDAEDGFAGIRDPFQPLCLVTNEAGIIVG